MESDTAEVSVLERFQIAGCRLQIAGCRRVVHWLPSGGLPVVEEALERWESPIAELTGES